MRCKHTPGPWRIKGRVAFSGEAIRVEGLDGYQVADVIDANGDPQNESNLNLIAAAPDLLKAVEMLLANRDDVSKQVDAIGVAISAIARAEGRQL